MLGCCREDSSIDTSNSGIAKDPAMSQYLSSPQKVFDVLDGLGATYKTHEHEHVVTIEEEKKFTHHIEGHHTINMFVKDYKGKKGKLYLISLPHDAKWDFKTLGAKANDDKLRSKLGVTSGAVTPLAVCNNQEKDVTVVIDKALLAGGAINYHPLVQDKTTTMAPLVLLKFLRAMGFEPLLISLTSNPTLAPEISSFLAQAPSTSTSNASTGAGKKQKKEQKEKKEKKEKKGKPQKTQQKETSQKNGATGTVQPPPYPRPQHYAGLSEFQAAELNRLRAAIAQKEATRYLITKMRN